MTDRPLAELLADRDRYGEALEMLRDLRSSDDPDLYLVNNLQAREIITRALHPRKVAADE